MKSEIQRILSAVVVTGLLGGALTVVAQDNPGIRDIHSLEGSEAVSAGHCDLLEGNPIIIHHKSGLHVCAATATCPRAVNGVKVASSTTKALDEKTCPEFRAWPERNRELAKAGKEVGIHAAPPTGELKNGVYYPLENGTECKLRDHSVLGAEYYLTPENKWASMITLEIECRGPHSANMPSFIACTGDGTVQVNGEPVMRARTIADCWNEKNRLPYTSNHTNTIKMMSEEDFEQLVAQRKKDRKSNNGLIPSAARVAAGETPTNSGKTHEQVAGDEKVSRRPDSVESSLAIAR